MREGTLDSDLLFVRWDGDDLFGRISFVKLGSELTSVMTPVITDPPGYALINLAIPESERVLVGENVTCRLAQGAGAGELPCAALRAAGREPPGHGRTGVGAGAGERAGEDDGGGQPAGRDAGGQVPTPLPPNAVLARVGANRTGLAASSTG